MAQIIEFDSGSYYIGNPILYRVTADTVNGITVFHRVVMEVTATLYGDVAPGHQISSAVNKMSQPVANGGQALIDISSALRSVLNDYQYGPEPPGTALRVIYTLRAWDEYMIDGETYDERNTHISTHGGATVYPGTLSDRERMGTIEYRGSAKPVLSSPEICVSGQIFVGPMDSRTEPPFVIGMAELVESMSCDRYYVLPAATPDCYQMRFVNRYGCHESVCVHSLRSASVKYEVKQHVIARQQSLAYTSRGISRKLNDRETWKLSTHPLDERWQQWWLHEVLTAENAWLLVDGLWLQIHIIPEETVTYIDRSKGDALTVEFSLQFDITGSPFNI